jgi:hypothetical protein
VLLKDKRKNLLEEVLGSNKHINNDMLQVIKQYLLIGYMTQKGSILGSWRCCCSHEGARAAIRTMLWDLQRL